MGGNERVITSQVILLFCLGNEEYPEGSYIGGYRVEARKLAFLNTEQEYHPPCCHIRCVVVEHKIIRGTPLCCHCGPSCESISIVTL